MIVSLVFLAITVAALTGALCVQLFGYIGFAVAPFAASIAVALAAIFAYVRR